MKSKTKVLFLLTPLIIFLFFSIYNNKLSKDFINNDNYLEFNGKNQIKKKQAGFWDLTGSPISIDDSDPSKNWSYTASQNDWLSGSGNWTDPYIIENVTFDGQGSEYGIEIWNSDIYFVIRNSTMYNISPGGNGAGIMLYNVSNGKIINNNCSDNYNHGIFLFESNNNTLSGNIVTKNSNGITLGVSSNNTLSGNTANNNNWGIYLHSYSDNNTLSGNNASNNRENGIMFQDNCNNNTLSGNIVNNNRLDGIILWGGDNNIISNNTANNNLRGIHISWYGKYNKLLGNTARNNSVHGIIVFISDNITLSGNSANDNGNSGIFIGSSYNDTIFDNTINNNSYGIWIDSDSENNNILLNNFKDNGINAIDNGIADKWDNGSIGNSWDDYGGVDIDDNGIGDTSYSISGTAGAVDNYPIWDDGINPPEIVINYPSMYDVFRDSAPEFNITITDGNPINATWYTIDSGITNYTFSGLTGTVNQTAWDSKETELLTLRFYANDSLGHIGFNDIIIWKDITTPKIAIISPTSNYLCGVDAPTFSLTIVEPNIQIKCYSINGRPNITFTTETQFSQSEWNTVGNGTVSITFYVVDKAGNSNSSNVYVRKDAFIPVIIIHTPSQDEIFTSNSPEFNISIVEEDIVSMWYTIEGIAGTFPISGLVGDINLDAWGDAPEGGVTITFYVLDRAGNIGSESVDVIKNIPTLPSISGYNLFYLLGVLSIIMILISKKVNKSIMSNKF